VVDPNAGFVVRTVNLVADPVDSTSPFAALAGSAFGIDFNPTADRLRIVSNAGQNLRVNVDAGLTVTDADLNPGAPNVTGVAYINPVANPAPATTTLTPQVTWVSFRLSRPESPCGCPTNGRTMTCMGHEPMEHEPHREEDHRRD
jgi:hypothetical protein